MTGSQLSSIFSGITLYQRQNAPLNTRQAHLSNHSLSQKVNDGTRKPSWLVGEVSSLRDRFRVLPAIALKISNGSSLVLTCN